MQPTIEMPGEDPIKPGAPKPIELVLAEQANEAMQGGADPHAATDMLGTMLKHLKTNPQLAQHANESLAQGVDPHAISGKIWEMANGKPAYTNDEKFAGAMLGAIPFGAKALAGIDAVGSALPRALGGEGTGLNGIGSRYTATRDRLMGAEQAALDEHPIAARATEVATGAVPFLAGGGIMSALGMGAKEAAPLAASRLARAAQGLVQGAKGGAVYGAAEGAGRATGGVKDYATKTATGAVTGGATGGLLGGVLGSVLPGPIEGADAKKSPLGNMASTGFAGGADEATVQVPPGQRFLAPDSPDNTVSVMKRAVQNVGPDRFKQMADGELTQRGATTPEGQQAAVEETARKIAAGQPVTAPVQGGSRAGDITILRALQKKGMTVDDAQQAVDQWRVQGSKPQTLIELLGKQGARLGRAVRAASPEAGETLDTFLEGRSESAPARAIDDALEASGIQKRSNGFRTLQQFVKDRSAEADKAYTPAFADERPITHAGIQEILDTPAGASAWKSALRMMKNKGITVPTIEDTTFDPSTLPAEKQALYGKLLKLNGGQVEPTLSAMRTLGEDVGAPSGKPRVTPTLQQAHYLKLALDDGMRPGLDRGEGAGGLGYNEGLSVREVQKKLLDIMDQHSPAYRQARAQYADKSSLIDANNVGMKLFHMQPEEFEQALSEMGSDAERQTARRAGMDALAKHLENGPDDPMRRAGKTDATTHAKRIRLLFPDDASYGAFRQRIGQESQMVKNHRDISGGSQTADKLADLSNMLGINAHDLANLATGRGHRVLTSQTVRRVEAAMQGVNREKAAALAPDLTASGPDAVSQVLQRVGGTAKRINAQRATTRGQLLKAAGIAGGIAGGSETRRQP